MNTLSLAELKTFLSIQISCLILGTLLVLVTNSWYINYHLSTHAVLFFYSLATLLFIGALVYIIACRNLNRRWLEIAIVFYAVVGVLMALLFIFFS